MPKQANKEQFQISLDNVKFDVQLRSFAKKYNVENYNTVDNFQSTKLDILISSSNTNNSGNFESKQSQNSSRLMYTRINNANKESPLQQKISKHSISDNTKKLLTKVYEIDLVPLTTPTASQNSNNNYNNKSMKENKSFMRSNSSNTSIFKSQNLSNNANSSILSYSNANNTKGDKQG